MAPAGRKISRALIRQSRRQSMQDRVDAIYEARKRFIDADERYQQACQTADDLTLDIRVAKRAGNDVEVAVLQSKYAEHSQNVWWPAYKEWKASAKALMSALDVDADRIGRALS
jgi:Tfp pilus assembly protein PilF